MTTTRATLTPAAREHEVPCRACRRPTTNITGYCPCSPERRAREARHWANEPSLATHRRAELVAGCLDVN